MADVFLKIVNMSISASWLVLAVLVFRLVFKKAPKWIHVLLWGIVAVRLLCPFSIESALSLIPSAETISPEIMMDWTPEISTGIAPLDQVVNPVISTSFAPNPATSANPLQILIPVAANLWFLGVFIMLLYTVVSYWRLKRKVCDAVILRDNIYQSENAASPFVLGIIKPKIYLPFQMDGQNLEHVVSHEQAHIRRRDHWWKPLGFLLLTIYWFNPLMWLAYVLLCRDIELACDEKVVKELGMEQRADYSQALLACSVNRRMIAACPLAFGEVGVKERVKTVLNYKKPAFWVIVVSVVACAVVAVCFLTNPAAEREFPINGKNVSNLDTAHVLEKIAKAEKVENGSKLYVNADNFDLMFTSDFDWANDGAIRFFYYGKNQKIYSAQLRMFHDDNKYFITDSSEWIEQDKIFLLAHYLDALKHIPQEEVRRLSPDADGYSVYMRHEGSPEDYDRVLKYSQNGVNTNDGWYIHLEVQPLHEVEDGGYNGSGDEVIHLFYNNGDERDDIAGKTYLYEKDGIVGSFTITLYNDGTFVYYEGSVSSYIALGTWKQEGDIITITDDGPGCYGLVNHFKRDGDDLLFIAEDSDNFVYVKVQDGERFHCTGEAFKQADAPAQLGGNQTLSLNDVIMLSQKGYDLTWSDFDQYRYIETGSGLYIRLYEINEKFGLSIGGVPNKTPMYIYLSVNADDANAYIDIRDGGVEEFISENAIIQKTDGDAIDANSAIFALTERLMEAGIIYEGMTGYAGEPIEWAKEVIERPDGSYVHGQNPDVEVWQIYDVTCYVATLLYGDFDSVMAGRLYGIFAITHDRDRVYQYDLAEATWSLLENDDSTVQIVEPNSAVTETEDGFGMMVPDEWIERDAEITVPAPDEDVDPDISIPTDTGITEDVTIVPIPKDEIEN